MSEETVTKFNFIYPTRSSEIGELVKALAAAQKEFKPLKKSSINPFYSTDKKVAKYAELSDVIDATQFALASHGLSVIQRPTSNLAEQTASIETMLAHESGQWIANELTLPATGKGYNNAVRFDAQTIGAAQTYARRYSWQAIVGISAEPDNDANELVEQGSKEAAKAVGQAKVEALKAKVGQQAKIVPAAPQAARKASVEAVGDVVRGLVKSVTGKKSAKGSDYRAIEMVLDTGEELNLSAFDDHKYANGSSTFAVLDLTQTLTQPCPAVFRVKNNGKYVNLAAIEKLGNVEFEDGEPVIQRDEAITDDDLPPELWEEREEQP